MIMIFRRGTDCRILRGIEKFESREVLGLGPAVLFWDMRGGGTAFSERYLATYDEAIAIGGWDIRMGIKLRWVIYPGDNVLSGFKADCDRAFDLDSLNGGN